jgi:DNA-3-methyladenine glycosylase II
VTESEIETARRALVRRDPVLGAVIRRVGACALEQRGKPYAGLLRSILFQQLAGAAALSIERKVLGHFGGRYPKPEVLLARSDEQLRSLGLSRQKIAAMRNVATAFASGAVRERALFRLADDTVVTQLTAIKGIGEWTAHMLLMFNLGRMDVLPVGDYGVRKGVQQLYRLDALPNRATVTAIGERWRPYRSVASWYVWRSMEKG